MRLHLCLVKAFLHDAFSSRAAAPGARRSRDSRLCRWLVLLRCDLTWRCGDGNDGQCAAVVMAADAAGSTVCDSCRGWAGGDAECDGNCDKWNPYMQTAAVVGRDTQQHTRV